MNKKEFKDAMTGKPEERIKIGPKILHGYIIRDLNDFLYVTGTVFHLNRYRKIKNENDLFWVLEEKLNPFNPVEIILYKSKDIAETHLEELKNGIK